MLLATIILVIIGVIGIYSAGYGSVDGSNTEYQKQLILFGVVLLIEIFLWAVDTRALEFIGYAIYALSFILLIVVLAMPSVYGAHSWILIQGFSYQPSELMKIGFILCAAKAMSMYKENKESPKPDKKKSLITLGMIVALFVIPVFLIILQPDFGTALVYLMIMAFMLFKLGIKYRYIIAAILLVLILVPVIYNFLPAHAKTRIDVFLNPELDPLGDGYNAIQSKIAVGAEYLPDPIGSSILKRIKYRAGAYYNNPYYKLDGVRASKEWGVSAGLSIPLLRSRSYFNISAQYARVNGQTTNFINENQLRVNIGVTFNERWFYKTRVN